jgi:hypothetical protein
MGSLARTWLLTTSLGDSRMYLKFIDLAKKLVAVLFAVCGLGYGIAANSTSRTARAILGASTLVCLVLVFGFFVEYIIRLWVERRTNGVKAFQFTLTEMLALTTVLAVVLGLYYTFGQPVVVMLILGVVLVGCAVEFADRVNRPQRSDPGVDHAPSRHVLRRRVFFAVWRYRWRKYRLQSLLITACVVYVLIAVNTRYSRPIALDDFSRYPSGVAPALPAIGYELGWPWTYKFEANWPAGTIVDVYSQFYNWGLFGDVVVGLTIVIAAIVVSERFSPRP